MVFRRRSSPYLTSSYCMALKTKGYEILRVESAYQSMLKKILATPAPGVGHQSGEFRAIRKRLRTFRPIRRIRVKPFPIFRKPW